MLIEIPVVSARWLKVAPRCWRRARSRGPTPRVLVVDDGRPRNAPAQHVHGLLSRDGLPPAELLATGRMEVAGYGGQVVRATARRAQRLDSGSFRVVLADGSTLEGRRLLVTTGLVDELPEVPGVTERWGRDVLHCPYCHGWEVRDQPLGVLATGPTAVHQALLWRQWSDKVTLFLHTAPDPGPAEWEQLAARDVRVMDGEVERLVVTGDRLTGIQLAGGRIMPQRAVVVAPRFTARAAVLASLGLTTTEQRVGSQVIGELVVVDANGATSVPGVWAAGNVADLTAQVVGAAAAGARAAQAINTDLVAEDAHRAAIMRRDPFNAQVEREGCERVLGHRRHGMGDRP